MDAFTHLGFSRSGWTSEAPAYQKNLQIQKSSGKNWQMVGMRLLNLNQVDQDLERWSTYVEPDQDEIKI